MPTTIIIRALISILGIGVFASGIYIKGRMDGVHIERVKTLKNNNKLLEKTLEQVKIDIANDVERLKNENRVLTDLNKKLNNNLKEITNELPKDDSFCNYPDGSSERLRKSLEDANSSVFDQPSD